MEATAKLQELFVRDAEAVKPRLFPRIDVHLIII